MAGLSPRLRTLTAICGIWVVCLAGPSALPRAIVVSFHPAATAAGVQMLNQDGNAFDAFVAATLAEYVVNEINEHFAPEINGRFVRVTRGDGRIVYVFGMPKDQWFDPAAVRSLGSVSREHSQEVDVGDDRELLLHVLPYTNRDGDQFLVGVSDRVGPRRDPTHGAPCEEIGDAERQAVDDDVARHAPAESEPHHAVCPDRHDERGEQQQQSRLRSRRSGGHGAHGLLPPPVSSCASRSAS